MEHSPEEIAQMERLVEELRQFGLSMWDWPSCPMCKASGTPSWVHKVDCPCVRALDLALGWQNRKQELSKPTLREVMERQRQEREALRQRDPEAAAGLDEEEGRADWKHDLKQQEWEV